MPSATRLVDDDSYADLGGAFQFVQIAILDEALRSWGIDDAKLREEICGHFLFKMGVLYDQSWFKVNGRLMHALICFVEAEEDAEGHPDVGLLGTVHLPSEEFSYHDYAFGSVSEFYEGNPASRVETGLGSDEDEGEDED